MLLPCVSVCSHGGHRLSRMLVVRQRRVYFAVLLSHHRHSVLSLQHMPCRPVRQPGMWTLARHAVQRMHCLRHGLVHRVVLLGLVERSLRRLRDWLFNLLWSWLLLHPVRLITLALRGCVLRHVPRRNVRNHIRLRQDLPAVPPNMQDMHISGRLLLYLLRCF
jgi:hypothetical protein